ncbi:MAG: hypothetical protein FJY77_05840 [Candidatus Altiarchaeales archaeon]|nr:hypothetical protein [Candidatus Altiarchaeales archaeon]
MAEKDVRVKTGINGFDELIGGGIPDGNIVLLSGAAGTGKSIFAFEFIYHGAKKFNDNGVYITLEEFPERFIANAKKLGFSDLDDFLAQKKMTIVKTEIFDIYKLVSTIEDLIDQYKAKRLVLDSLSVLSAFSDKPFIVRKAILDLASMLRRQNVTAIFPSGVSTISDGHFGVSVEEYVVDGVISMFHQMAGTQFIRAINIVKMRGTAHTENLHPLIIKEGGITVVKSSIFPENFTVG